MARTIYQPLYAKSRALVVGINAYRFASPLACARNDAEAVSKALTSKFGFNEEHVTTLLDDDATRSNVMSAFLGLAGDDVSEDDRVIVFFAGHGHTKAARRGEVGYLVPVDGDPEDLASLIRWDDLTRNAELIVAKHVLFVMDACYGGLAVTRALPPGSQRFLKSMLQRYSRQVLTSGKADEVVADAGGPRRGHSIFTGYFLDAIEGAAATPDGILSANAVMAYTYERVSRDSRSQQSPHFGFLDGDGDLILDAPILKKLTAQTHDEDVLVESMPAASSLAMPSATLVDTIKESLADSRYRIRLSDLIKGEVRRTRDELRGDEFNGETPYSNEVLLERIRAYESVIAPLEDCIIVVSHWAAAEHKPTLEFPLIRLAEGITDSGGYDVWIALRWFPIVVLMYAGGIAALAADNYDALATILSAKLQGKFTGEDPLEAACRAPEGFLCTTPEIFKRVPGHERHVVPASEYLFKALQPRLEDALFLGTSYEGVFDRFEIIYSLACAYVRQREGGHLWGPIGRFGWKQRRHASPFERLVAEATAAGDKWGPLSAGMFGGTSASFAKFVAEYQRDVLVHARMF